jgi:GNAT superfamily N-acetyltransferase
VSGAREGASYVIEPLDPSKHDRAAFSCGVAQVDNYFRNSAGKLARAGNVRVHVMTDRQGALIGFHALNAHAIHYGELPRKLARDRPGHGQIPAAFISMIGVDQARQGHGFGGDLLVDALRRIARAADQLGIRVVLLDVLDCGDPAKVEQRRKLYRSYGFEALPSNPMRMFLPVADVRAIIAEEG